MAGAGAASELSERLRERVGKLQLVNCVEESAESGDHALAPESGMRAAGVRR